MLLLIDNYDSFTYNLVHYFTELQVDVKVVRNDEMSVAHVAALKPDYIVISPGPCSPSEAGVSLALIEAMAGKVPILGVCLGHQAMAQVFGGRIVQAEHIVHGKTSAIMHNQQGVFQAIPQSFMATRYHSLAVEAASLPACLEVTAWTKNQTETIEIMGLRHRTLAIEGVQFHPESILTDYGHQLLNNFLNIYHDYYHSNRH